MVLNIMCRKNVIDGCGLAESSPFYVPVIYTIKKIKKFLGVEPVKAFSI